MSKETILIVDDEPTNLAVLNTALRENYRIRVANSGQRALDVAITAPVPDLIILDIMMPDMDGYAVLEKLKSLDITREIPVIFVTAMETERDEEEGLSMGAVDYITKPVRPAILQARVKTHLMLKQASDILHNQNDYLEAEVTRRMQENHVIQNVSIRALAHLAEIRDPETGEHILRTQAYIKLLAVQLQISTRFKSVMTDHYIQMLTKSAPLHDIGKVGIPDEVLLKPGKLSDDEWEIMKTHAALGAKAIEQAEKDVDTSVEFLSIAKEIAHWHHERWDGTGYPDGLVANDIPLSARLMAVADGFDALISVRVYKSAMSFNKAKTIIVAGKGDQFDPDIIDAFVACFDGFVAVAKKYQSESLTSDSKEDMAIN